MLKDPSARTDYYYDATGRQIAVLGPVVTIGGVPQRALSESIFDPAGRLIRSRANISIQGWSNDHPLGITGSRSELNPIDRLAEGAAAQATRDDSAAQTTFYEYDPAGRQTAVVTTSLANEQYDANGTAGAFDTLHARMHLRSETVYDGFGRRTAGREGLRQDKVGAGATIDASQVRETTYEYDSRGNLTAVILPAVAHPTLLDANNDPLLVRPRYEYTYDQYGNRLTIRDNVVQKLDGGVYYNHAAATSGNFSQNFDTRVTKFTYDHRNRQTSRQLPEGVAGNGTFVERMFYDDRKLTDVAASAGSGAALGQLAFSVEFEGRITEYRYDNTTQGGGRLVEKRYYNAGAVNVANNTTTDSLRAALPTMPAEKVTYAYDANGREKEVQIDRTPANTGDPLLVTTTTYDAEGRPTSIQSPEGTLNYQYDSVTGQLSRTYTTNTDVGYLYDALGRIQQVSTTKRFGTTLGAPDVTYYAYDLVGNCHCAL